MPIAPLIQDNVNPLGFVPRIEYLSPVLLVDVKKHLKSNLIQECTDYLERCDHFASGSQILGQLTARKLLELGHHLVESFASGAFGVLDDLQKA